MIRFDDIVSVYDGRDRECCCGCAGDHIYHSERHEEGSEHRGYEVRGEEIDDERFLRIIEIINSSLKVEDLGVCVSTVIGNRIYIAYRRKDSATLVKEKRATALAKLTPEERDLLGV